MGTAPPRLAAAAAGFCGGPFGVLADHFGVGASVSGSWYARVP
jgi:hypothetical protein